MKKKIFALLLALVMVFSMAMSVSAAEAETDGAALVLDVSTGRGSVTVSVYLQGCSGVTNGRFTVGYDAEVLTLADVQTYNIYAVDSVNDLSAGSVTLAWVGSELTAEKTLMLTLVLQIAEGSTKDLTYTVQENGIYSADGAVSVSGDSVTIGYNAPVDTTALQNAIDAAGDLVSSEYSASSFQAVQDALAHAVEVLADVYATQAEVDTATKALNDAIAALRPAGAADVTLLQAAIAEAEKINSALYTEESYNAMRSVLADAKAVLENLDATQEEVDAATKALNDALDALQLESPNVPTGDEQNIFLWALAMLISAAAVIAAMVLLIRNGKSKQVCRFLSLLLVSAMMLSFMPISSLAVVDGEDEPSEGFLSDIKDIINGDYVIQGEDTSFIGTVKQVFNQVLNLKLDQNMSTLDNVYDAKDLVRVIVELDGAGLLEQGYTMDQISANGEQVAADTAKLLAVQNYVAAEIEKIVSASGLTKNGAVIKYHYTVALNGLAITVPYGTLTAIRKIAGVDNAYVASEYNAPESKETVSTPSMYATSGSFGSAQTWEELGYSGEGMQIAIIDTGLDVDHPSFAADPEGAGLTLADIERILPELNAYDLFSQTSAVKLTAKDLYYNAKVPYGFNYVDAGIDVTHDYDGQGDHGTHVAGIAAANKMDTTDVVGVAPNAQVVVMKVFGQSGGAFSDDILAAIEDAILLGVDVINMSLGAQAGFSEDSALINEVYGRILENDMLLAVAAGNANSAATGNNLGTNLNLTQDPDNGLVNSPATYLAATTVASLENVAKMMPYFSVGEHKIAYVDVTYFDFSDLYSTYQYVVVPGIGDVSDYEGLDLHGKIALVQRGTIDFVSKQKNAYDAGATALIVYDNVEGELLSMFNGEYLPNVFISKADGEKMIAAAVNGEGTLTIHPFGVETAIPSSTAGQLSDFSCWGVTPDLQLVPDVTAPGGNIYSCYTDGAYGTMSGTSMACPHIAGMSALVLQYLHEQYPDLTDAEYHIITESLVMCTAVPVEDPDGILYSPRKQGAGSANVYSAITSPVYLTSYQDATGEYTPKASMGDDPQRTGVFVFTFDMNNLTGVEQVYMLDGSLLTDQFLEYEGNEYMSETGRDLSGIVSFAFPNSAALSGFDFDGNGASDMGDVQYALDVINGMIEADADMTFDLNHDATIDTRDAQYLYELVLESVEAQRLVTVPANGSVTVTVTVELSAEDMAYMDAHYENGIYVDGFVRAYAQSEGAVDLCLPLVGFYGDWTDARMFDNGWYYDPEVNDEDPDNDYYYNRYLNVVFATLGDYVSTFGGLGTNPYILEDYDPAHNVLSPNGDMYYDYVPDIYISLMRSAELLDFTWTDDETGEELFYEWYAYARKSYYWSGFGMCLPAIYTDADCEPFTFLDENGNLVVEDLQHLTLTIRGYLDDGDLDDIGYTADGDPIPNKEDADEIVEIPVVIDLQAPIMDLDSLVYFSEDGRNYVSFNVEDNYDIAAVVATTLGGGAYEYIPVTTKDSAVDGEKATITLDITDFDAGFQIVLCDYGCNESYYQLVNDSYSGLDEGKFYAFRRYSTIESGDYVFGTDSYNGWYSFESADSMKNHTSQATSGESIVYAAEYVDGYIFGAQAGPFGYNTLFVMKEGSWDRIPFGGEYEMRQYAYEWPGQTGTYYPMQLIALDMAYDYTTDTMYMLCNALENNYFPEGETNILCELNLETGAVKVLGKILASSEEAGEELYDEFLALTLACDNDGNLFTVDYETGKLYAIDKAPAETTPKYGYGTYMASCISSGDSQYYPAAYTQSMTVDHATNKLYWAAYQSVTGTAAFIEFDKETGSVVSMTYTADNAELVGLFKPWSAGRDIIADAELEGINLSKDALYMTVGQNATLFVTAAPFNANVGEVTWSSDNESVATVNPYGMVVATGLGTATITVSNGSFTAECEVSVSNVSGTLYGYSGEYWLLMDAGKPFEANQVVDAMEMEGTVKAAAYRSGYLYVAAVAESFDAEYNTLYTTYLYKLNASTLQGELVGSYEGNTTALAFNYADGLMYGMVRDADDSVALVIVNMSTAECMTVNSLEDVFDYDHWQYCSGALAIDYEGNFYVNGDNENYEYNLVRFNLDENNEIINVVEFEGFSAYSWSGDSMVWSERNGGLLHIAGNKLTFVDVSDMENVAVQSLGEVRGAGSTVLALSIPLTSEPEVEGVPITGIKLEESYAVAEDETIRVIPTITPWNAVGEFTYEIADETIAYVDRNGIVTGVTVGETTLVVTEVATGMSASTTIVVTENPGYLYGYFQANLEEMIPLEAWARVPIADPYGSNFMHDNIYDLTIYAGAYFDGELYAVGMHSVNGKYYMLKISPSNFTYKIICEAEHMIRAMSFDYTTGTMYVLANDENVTSGLYQMDLDTMELTLVGDNDTGAMLVAMAIDDKGTIYVTDDYGEIYTMDKATAELLPTGIYGRSSLYLQSMVYDYNNDTIYWAVGGTIYDVDVDAGTLTSVGESGCVISALFTVPEVTPEVPETMDPAGVVLGEKNTVAVGETFAIEAVVLPVSVATVDHTLTWSTSDESVATVDENGVITGVSAGTAYIIATDAKGNSDSILITVTAEHRYFYGYDELSCSWVRFDKDGVILESWPDDKSLSPIVAATYIDDTLYAYDKDGYFYTIDTETFQRMLLGNGISGMTTSLEAWDQSHNQQVYYVDNVPYIMIDLTYSVEEGRRGTVTTLYGVMMAWNVSSWCDDFSYKFVELDLETGEVLEIIIEDEQMDGMDMRPTNILYCNGYLYAIDGFITGMISKIDPYFGDKSIAAICPEYWGDFNGGRSLIEDPLTGEIYAIRDMRTEYIGVEDYQGMYSTSVLVSMNLQIGRASVVGTVGTNMRIIGLFIK